MNYPFFFQTQEQHLSETHEHEWLPMPISLMTVSD